MYKDLREWLEIVESLGELKTFDKEVDLKEEMSAINFMVNKAQNEKAPALLFENIKGYEKGFRTLFNMYGPSINRYAISMGLPTGLDLREYVELTREKIDSRIEPKVINQEDAAINENVIDDEAKVDITKFPAPLFWPLDGGSYIGTADAVITRDPETGRHNLGTYRVMVHNEREVGLYVSPGKDARIHIESAWKKNKPLEVAVCLGVDPLTMAFAGWSFDKSVSEYEFIGGIKGEPVEVVKGLKTDLLIPANAEVVIEGILRPNNLKDEGPFGEFTGYYGRPETNTPVIEIKAIRYRNNPIITCALMAEYPSCEHALMVSIVKSALIRNDLSRLGIPGIKGVYSYPASAASYGMNVISMEQKFAGHVSQVLSIASQVSAGSYYAKWIVAVEEDVDPFDINQVLWAMATRCNPVEDIDILRNTWSTYLDPTQNPPDNRPYGSKALINACREHRFLDTFSKRTKLRQETYVKVCSRWSELGLPGEPPKDVLFEEDL
jgi:UbiD family decarboxylase